MKLKLEQQATASLENHQVLLLKAVREMIQIHFERALNLANQYGFSIKAGSGHSTMVVLGANNVHCIHRRL